jgi:3-carboxy-cis,cis-muconate cycloisomerase
MSLGIETDEGPFAGIYARGAAAQATSGAAWLRAMLDVEAALARACARVDLVSAEAAETIVAACQSPQIDPAELARAAAEHASPVVPLVVALREQVGPELAHHVHLGATSQDILDTAMMLIAKRALDPIIEDARAAASASAALAQSHRETAIRARTLLQDALPTSSGLVAAGWMLAIDESIGVLRTVPLAVQMGGPVGHRDPALGAEVGRLLDLDEPVVAWHTNRNRPARLASALGLLSGALSKLARDVTLTPELREGVPGRGGSTAMGDKHNPVAAVSVLACARRVPGLVATMLSCMEQERERAAGAWQAEWGTITDLLRLTGSAAAWARDLLEHLEVDAEAMRTGAGQAPDLGASAELIDRALGAHRR